MEDIIPPNGRIPLSMVAAFENNIRNPKKT
jgi:hypothetical protein